MIKPTMLAPDFSADAYYLGNRTTVTLSNYKNDWVLLFFYASDFTFV
jgi:peroxiredoxin (alkyl hydroperoxide reductase subunit C)